jgi:hypothetical protein
MTIKTAFYRESSFITNVSWDDDTEFLLVKFNSGTTWIYYGVSQDVYNRLIKSISVGEYFNKNIRNKFESVRLNYPVKDLTDVKKEDQKQVQKQN